MYAGVMATVSSIAFPAALTILALLVGPTHAAAPLAVHVDATDAPRRLIHTEVTVPLAGRPADQPVALRLVEWTPGNHNPSGPIQNVVDFRITDDKGRHVGWRRDEISVYRHLASPAPDAEALIVRFSYIANQPGVNSRSSDSYGFASFGAINWNTALVYPEWADKSALIVAPTLTLPDGWRAASALRLAPGVAGSAPPRGNTVVYAHATLAEVVDSPVIFGSTLRTWEMPAIPTAAGAAAPHALHAVAPRPDLLELPAARLDKFARMHDEAARIFGPFPYDRYHYLVILGNELPGLGLEHATSTFISMGEDRFVKAEGDDSDPMAVIPHEYAHVWCGKLVAPRGLLSRNYHTPGMVALLWVYEGLVSYYDEILCVRSGLMSRDEHTHSLVNTLASYGAQAGRRWRSIEDTALAMRFLRAPSDAWQDLRRGQDYYAEASLFWMHADAVIRAGTGGEKSLDDFCRLFFAPADGVLAAPGEEQRTYTRDDVVAALRTVYSGEDWDALISRLIEKPDTDASFELPVLLGHRLEWSHEPTALQRKDERRETGVNLRLGLGVQLAADGRITRVTPGSAADAARLSVGQRIIAVRGPDLPDRPGPMLTFTPARLRDAAKRSRDTGVVECLIATADEIDSRRIEYAGGLRYPRLVHVPGAPDLLAQIQRPSVPSPSSSPPDPTPPVKP